MVGPYFYDPPFEKVILLGGVDLVSLSKKAEESKGAAREIRIPRTYVPSPRFYLSTTKRSIFVIFRQERRLGQGRRQRRL